MLKNRYLYQGKELGQELGLGLYDFHARSYDPLLGRFTSIDPMDQFASGYTGMGNNPVNMVDPDGRFAGLLSAMFGGALVGANNAYQSGGNPWQGAAQGAFGAGITAGLGMFAPSGALGPFTMPGSVPWPVVPSAATSQALAPVCSTPYPEPLCRGR